MPTRQVDLIGAGVVFGSRLQHWDDQFDTVQQPVEVHQLRVSFEDQRVPGLMAVVPARQEPKRLPSAHHMNPVGILVRYLMRPGRGFVWSRLAREPDLGVVWFEGVVGRRIDLTRKQHTVCGVTFGKNLDVVVPPLKRHDQLAVKPHAWPSLGHPDRFVVSDCGDR